MENKVFVFSFIKSEKTATMMDDSKVAVVLERQKG
jgi:hypothetical protein